jgi:TFIIF-interacting CTD phosphatase-like protein
MNKLYEIIIFTASVEEYAKPLIELIDNKNYCSYILYREQLYFR